LGLSAAGFDGWIAHGVQLVPHAVWSDASRIQLDLHQLRLLAGGHPTNSWNLNQAPLNALLSAVAVNLAVLDLKADLLYSHDCIINIKVSFNAKQSDSEPSS
jgi:hypothetical protein